MSKSDFLHIKMIYPMVQALEYITINRKLLGLLTTSNRITFSIRCYMKITGPFGLLFHKKGRCTGLPSWRWKMKTKKSISSTKIMKFSRNLHRKKFSRSSKTPLITPSSFWITKKALRNWWSHWKGSQKLQDSLRLKVSRQINLRS